MSSMKPDELIGNIINRKYKLIQALDHGAFGWVYQGYHLELEMNVAIKFLNSTLLAEQENIESFYDEMRSISNLYHRRIIHIYDSGRYGDAPYYVMPFIAGGNLRNRHTKRSRTNPRDLEKAKVHPRIVAGYVMQIAEALTYLHKRGLIHRDIKPENILINIIDESEEELILTDFGAALTNHHTISMILQEDIKGTPLYMAPEQFTGQANKQSDQYALAVMVYELLCGHEPFYQNTDTLFIEHNTVPPPPFSQWEVEYPEAEKVVRKALSKSFKQRYRSVEDFSEAFVKAVDPELLTKQHNMPTVWQRPQPQLDYDSQNQLQILLPLDQKDQSRSEADKSFSEKLNTPISDYYQKIEDSITGFLDKNWNMFFQPLGIGFIEAELTILFWIFWWPNKWNALVNIGIILLQLLGYYFWLLGEDWGQKKKQRSGGQHDIDHEFVTGRSALLAFPLNILSQNIYAIILLIVVKFLTTQSEVLIILIVIGIIIQGLLGLFFLYLGKQNVKRRRSRNLINGKHSY